MQSNSSPGTESLSASEDICRISGFSLAGEVETDDGPKTMSIRIPGLRVRAGEIAAAIGGSGCGKSVLFSLLMGYPSFGIGGRLEQMEYRMFGERMPENAFGNLGNAAAWRQRLLGAGGLFYLPQAFPVAKTQRVRTREAMIQIVRAMAAPVRLSCRTARKKIEEAFQRHCMETVLDRKQTLLSGGERRRSELLARLVAMKVAKRPALLLLDEPTTGFDPDNALSFIRDVRKVIDELCQEGIPAAALFSTHEMSCLDDKENGRRIVDRVCVVHRDAEGPGAVDCTVLFDGPADAVWCRFFPPGPTEGKRIFVEHGDDLFRTLKTKTTADWLASAEGTSDDH